MSIFSSKMVISNLNGRLKIQALSLSFPEEGDLFSIGVISMKKKFQGFELVAIMIRNSQ